MYKYPYLNQPCCLVIPFKGLVRNRFIECSMQADFIIIFYSQEASQRFGATYAVCYLQSLKTLNDVSAMKSIAPSLRSQSGFVEALNQIFVREASRRCVSRAVKTGSLKALLLL